MSIENMGFPHLNNTEKIPSSESKFVKLDQDALDLVEKSLEEMGPLKGALEESTDYTKNITRIKGLAKVQARKDIQKGLSNEEIIENIKLFLVDNLPNNSGIGKIDITKTKDFLKNIPDNPSTLKENFPTREDQENLVASILDQIESLPESPEADKTKLELSNKLRWLEDVFNLEERAA